MSTLSSANVTDVNLVLKERTHLRLCINMLIFTHNLGNWLISIMHQPIPNVNKIRHYSRLSYCERSTFRRSVCCEAALCFAQTAASAKNFERLEFIFLDQSRESF